MLCSHFHPWKPTEPTHRSAKALHRPTGLTLLFWKAYVSTEVYRERKWSGCGTGCWEVPLFVGKHNVILTEIKRSAMKSVLWCHFHRDTFYTICRKVTRNSTVSAGSPGSYANLLILSTSRKAVFSRGLWKHEQEEVKLGAIVRTLKIG